MRSCFPNRRLWGSVCVSVRARQQRSPDDHGLSRPCLALFVFHTWDCLSSHRNAIGVYLEVETVCIDITIVVRAMVIIV
jgi:hypothetical protein